MISRRTSHVPKEHFVFPRLLYCDSRCFQTCRWHSQVYCRCSLVLPGAPKVLSGTPRCSQTYYNNSDRTPVPVIRDSSYSEGQPECPSRVLYSPEIDASKFTLHILSDTPGGFMWLKYSLLMSSASTSYWRHSLKMYIPACGTGPSWSKYTTAAMAKDFRQNQRGSFKTCWQNSRVFLVSQLMQICKKNGKPIWKLKRTRMAKHRSAHHTASLHVKMQSFRGS